LRVLAVLAGRLVMKIGATHMRCAFGFRRVPLGKATLNVASILAGALFPSAAPVTVFAALRVVAGPARLMPSWGHDSIAIAIAIAIATAIAIASAGAIADIAISRLATADTLLGIVVRFAKGNGVAPGALRGRRGRLVLDWRASAVRLADEWGLASVIVVGLAALADSLRLVHDAVFCAVAKLAAGWRGGALGSPRSGRPGPWRIPFRA
jgi:hypothetical protein